MSAPGHDKFELLGVDEAVAVPVEDLERLPDLGSLQIDEGAALITHDAKAKCLPPVRELGTELLRSKSAGASLRNLSAPPISALHLSLFPPPLSLLF